MQIKTVGGDKHKLYQIEYDSTPRFKWVSEKEAMKVPGMVDSYLKNLNSENNQCLSKENLSFNKKKTAGI